MTAMIGEVIEQKYAIERSLGKGGMGAVYLAKHLGTKRPVAIKVIDERFGDDPEFLARFQREAEVMGRLRHPNVVNITDFGSATTSRGTLTYLVMEYLEGLNLDDYQKQNGALPVSLVLDLVEQISLALDEAHAQGIIHRDLKPQNIWLEPDRRGGFNVKVLDFGIAKMAEALPITRSSLAKPAQQSRPAEQDSEETLLLTAHLTSTDHFQTTVGSTLGTPAFMSPEQCAGDEVGYRSDIYSLGVVAFLLLTGRLPFEGDTGKLLRQHLDAKPPALYELNRNLHNVFSEAVLRALAKNPEDRPINAKAYADLLRANAEAEEPILRQSKMLPFQHRRAFLGMYAGLVCTIPLLVLMIGVAPFSRLYFSKVIGERVALGLMYAGCTIVLLFAISHLRGFVALIAIGKARQIPRRFLANLETQFRAFAFWRRGSWAGLCLWPVVCALEGSKGERAIVRGVSIARPLRHVAFAIEVRNYALTSCFLLVATYDPFFPALLSRTLTKSQFFTFMFGKLAIFLGIQLLYAAAPYFLYRRALNVEGLLGRNAPSRVKQANLRAELHGATVGWLVVPCLLLMFLLSIEGFRYGFAEGAGLSNGSQRKEHGITRSTR